MSSATRTASAAIAVALCVAAAAMPVGAADPAPLKVGDTLPALRAEDFEGAIPALAGKIVLVDFWASWCGPCRESFPALDALYAKYKDRGLVVLAVNQDEDAKAMQGFLKKIPVTFPVIRDIRHTLVAAAGVKTMPSSLLVDKTGAIVAIHAGFHGDKSIRELEQEIDTILGAAPAAKEKP